jgi:hypothetical protein
MTGSGTKRAAYAYFGATLANPFWSWSARSADESTVVLTWWRDEVDRKGNVLVYDMRNHPRLAEWQDRLGNRERVRNLIWARDHCGGLFRVVWGEADKARVRKGKNYWPDNNLRMRLIELNEQTGEFLAESTV